MMTKRLLSLLLICIVFFTSLGLAPAFATSANAAKADVIFFIDATGSMGPYIDSVKTNLTAFSQYSQDHGVDIRFSVVSFKDITSDGAASTVIYKWNESEWTSDVDAVKSTLDSISVYGGGDEPETPTEAMSHIWGGYTDLFRPGASRFAFLLTDASAKSSNEDPIIYSLSDMAAMLKRSSVYTSVVTRDELKSLYEPLYSETGGIFLDIDSNNYYELMLEFAELIVKVAMSKELTFEDVAVTNDSFSFTKKWEGGSENSIDFTLYKLDYTMYQETVYHHDFDKQTVSRKEWRYSARFSSPEACYVIEEPVDGYITQYKNVGVYAGITDRCCNGGTIINKKIPKTGDDTPLLLWAGMILLGAVGIGAALVMGKRRKAHE